MASTISSSPRPAAPRRRAGRTRGCRCPSAATIGSPAARASIAAMPKDSICAGRDVDVAAAVGLQQLSAVEPARQVDPVDHARCRRRPPASGRRCGPAPRIDRRSRIDSGTRSRTAETMRSNGIGRLRRASRMALTSRTSSPCAIGGRRHAATSTPLGRTVTSISGPRIRRSGSAATSLTAVKAIGRADQSRSRPQTRPSGSLCPSTQCQVTTTGRPRSSGDLEAVVRERRHDSGMDVDDVVPAGEQDRADVPRGERVHRHAEGQPDRQPVHRDAVDDVVAPRAVHRADPASRSAP